MELNLIEILKNVPIGTKLYSTVFGEVSLYEIDADEEYPIKVEVGCAIIRFTKEGKYTANFNGECTLFPSKGNRDWSTFKVESKYKVGDYLLKKDTNRVYKIILKIYDTFDLKCVTTDTNDYDLIFFMDEIVLDENFEILEKFPLNTLHPFDRVLVRLRPCNWRCAIFSSITKTGIIKTECCTWEMGVPYNDDTKHLLGTMDDAPEFYRQN